MRHPGRIFDVVVFAVAIVGEGNASSYTCLN
jgi:hypothetical protein